MTRVRYANLARQDLLELWLTIARQNPQSADRIYDRIEASCNRLADHPQLGPARPEIGEKARVLIVDRWLALYRLTPDGVQVVRIIDGVRDLARLDWPEDDIET